MSELIVALDLPDTRSALEMARRISGHAPWIKIGLELFTAAGPDIITKLKALGFKVFLDLKMHDIPQTVGNASLAAAHAGADMITLHLAGGEKMVRAAVEAMAKLGHTSQKPLIFGITVLTSIGQGDLPCFSGNIGDLAQSLAVSGKLWGLDGVVCSGHEVSAIKKDCGTDFLCLTPGIRLKDNAAGDQKRVMSPREAVEAGSNFLVVGRPITTSVDPSGVADRIIAEMRIG